MGLVNEPATVWYSGGEYGALGGVELLAEDSQTLLTESSQTILTEDLTFTANPATSWTDDSAPVTAIWYEGTDATSTTAYYIVDTAGDNLVDTAGDNVVDTGTDYGSLPQTVWTENDGS